MGQRHHFVPKMLLKNFASKSDQSTDKHWVHQTGKSGESKEVSIRDVAVQKHFYGKVASLESALAEQEGLAAGVFKLILSGSSPDDMSDEVSRFVWLQTFRTKSLRLAIKTAFEQLMAEFTSSASQENLGSKIRARARENFDEMLFSELPNQLYSDKLVLEEMLRVPKFREIMIEASAAQLSGQKIVDILSKLFPHLLNTDYLNRIVQETHVSALEKLVAQDIVPEPFKPKSWYVQEFPDHSLILGDTCVIALATDGRVGVANRFGNETACFLMPLSHDKLLVGRFWNEELKLEANAVNQASAALSWDYFYSSASNIQTYELSTRINSLSPVIDAVEIRKIVENFWQ